MSWAIVPLMLLGIGLAGAPPAGAVLPKIIEVCPGAGNCDFTSVNSAANDPGTNAGDRIRVDAGTYTEQVSVPKKLTIEGSSTGSRPVITWAANGATTFSIGSNAAQTTLQHLDIRATGTGATALSSAVAVTASDLALTATGTCASLADGASQLGPNVTATATAAGANCITSSGTVTGADVTATSAGSVGVTMSGGFGSAASLTDSTVRADTALDVEVAVARRDTLTGSAVGAESDSGGTITDSVVTSTASGGVAALDKAPAADNFSFNFPLDLRNVTAYAVGSNSKGLEAQYGAYMTINGIPNGTDPGAIRALNVIVRGAGVDASGDPGPGVCPGTCGPGTVALGYSNFRSTTGNVDTSTGHNQSGDPLLANPVVGAGQDFRETCGSPTVDAGTADSQNGPTDLAGNPRQIGSAPDIGAYETAKHAPVVSTGSASGVTTGTATLGGSVNPDGCPATYRFDYGTTTAYGSQAPPGGAPAGTDSSDHPESQAIAALAPGTTFHYRLVASNADGTSAGADRTFTTAPAAAATAGDTNPPVFLAASLAPRRFAVDSHGAAEVAVSARARRAPRGTTFRYTLSEGARVVFTVERVLPGRQVGRRCQRPTAANRRRHACKRYANAKHFAATGLTGANVKRFSGRIGRGSLPPGSYRVTLVATAAAGNPSAPTRLAFTVVRR